MHHKSTLEQENRLRWVALVFLVLALWILARLFMLQVVQHKYYSLFALNTHEMYQKIHPHRGSIYMQDSRTKQEFSVAVNRDYYLLYAVPKEIPGELIATTTEQLSNLLSFDVEHKKILLQKLAKSDSYEQIAQRVPEEVMQRIKAAGLQGVYGTPQEFRYYPEETMAAPVLGFCGFDDDGRVVGRYGVEGYWEKKIAGKTGFLIGEQGALGGWIALADRQGVGAENGPDLVLTIDRTLEYAACQRLRQGMEEYKAKSASLVMMNPVTGAIVAMCSLPDFDPNNYSKVTNISAFNNTTIFTAYEPGSVFKPITMAAGLDLGIVSPDTVYTDPCERAMNGYRIHNAENKCYGLQTMTEVLEKSINTGAVWVEEKVGNVQFQKYVEKFGFGQKTGIELNTEVAGDISSLDRKGQIFGANGSFGQGITATPLQVAAAYAAIAHEGKLPKPFIVDEVRYPNGRKEKTEPTIAEQVISPRASKLLSGMLVSVVENHYKAAKIPGFYVAGKTGTAQIAERGEYSANRTNHTFAGFAPADNPKLVLVVKYEEPERKWAEQTALPVFHDVMKFALEYYGIPKR